MMNVDSVKYFGRKNVSIVRNYIRAVLYTYIDSRREYVAVSMYRDVCSRVPTLNNTSFRAAASRRTTTDGQRPVKLMSAQ